MSKSIDDMSNLLVQSLTPEPPPTRQTNSVQPTNSHLPTPDKTLDGGDLNDSIISVVSTASDDVIPLGNNRNVGNRPQVDYSVREQHALRGLKQQTVSRSTANWAQGGAAVGATVGAAGTGIAAGVFGGAALGGALGSLGGPIGALGGILVGAVVGVLFPSAVGALIGRIRGKNQAANISTQSLVQEYQPGSQAFDKAIDAYNKAGAAQDKDHTPIPKDFDETEQQQIRSRFETALRARISAGQPVTRSFLSTSIAVIARQQADLRKVKDVEERFSREVQPRLNKLSLALSNDSTDNESLKPDRSDSSDERVSIVDEINDQVQTTLQKRAQKGYAITPQTIDTAYLNARMMVDPRLHPRVGTALAEVAIAASNQGAIIGHDTMKAIRSSLQAINNDQGLSPAQKQAATQSLTKEVLRATSTNRQQSYRLSPDYLTALTDGLRTIAARMPPPQVVQDNADEPQLARDSNQPVLDQFAASLRGLHVNDLPLRSTEDIGLKDGEALARAYANIQGANLPAQHKAEAAKLLNGVVLDNNILKKSPTLTQLNDATATIIQAERALANHQPDGLDQDMVSRNFRNLIRAQIMTGSDKDVGELLNEAVQQMTAPMDIDDNFVNQLRNQAQTAADQLRDTLLNQNSTEQQILQATHNAKTKSRAYINAANTMGLRANGSPRLKDDYRNKTTEEIPDLNTNPDYRKRGGQLANDDYTMMFADFFDESLTRGQVSRQQASLTYQRLMGNGGKGRNLLFANAVVNCDMRLHESNVQSPTESSVELIGAGLQNALMSLATHGIGNDEMQPQQIQQLKKQALGPVIDDFQSITRTAESKLLLEQQVWALAHSRMPTRQQQLKGVDRSYNRLRGQMVGKMQRERDPDYLELDNNRFDLRKDGPTDQMLQAVHVNRQGFDRAKRALLGQLPSVTCSTQGQTYINKARAEHRRPPPQLPPQQPHDVQLHRQSVGNEPVNVVRTESNSSSSGSVSSNVVGGNGTNE